MTIFEAKKFVQKKIALSSKTPALDADVFLQCLLKKDKTFVLLKKNFLLSARETRILKKWALLRAAGVPVAYITKKKEFFGYDFFVSPDVLIPKPDTEILVWQAAKIICQKIRDSKNFQNSQKNCDFENAAIFVCDVGAGSGCVSLSVFRSLLDEQKIPLEFVPQFLLLDISVRALKVAKKNAKNLLSKSERQNVKFAQSDLLKKIPQKFDVIISNPPYIPKREVDILLQDGRGEPEVALCGDVLEAGGLCENGDGLCVFRRLVLQAKTHLKSGGVFLCETGDGQAKSAAAFLEQNGFLLLEVARDLEGCERVVAAKIK